MNLYTKFLFFIFICVVTSKTKCCTKYTVNSPYAGPGAATTSGPVTLTTENLLRSGPGSAVISVNQKFGTYAEVLWQRFLRQDFSHSFSYKDVSSHKKYVCNFLVQSMSHPKWQSLAVEMAVDRQIIQQLQCLR